MPKVTKSHWVLVNVIQHWWGKSRNRGREGREGKKKKEKEKKMFERNGQNKKGTVVSELQMTMLCN